jgi:Mn-containing catalase
MKAFTVALETLGKPRFSIGQIPPTPGLVEQFFNESTGEGEDGEIDVRAPWNEGEGFEFVDAPAFAARRQTEGGGGAIDDRSTSVAGDPERVETLLVEQLQDILHAEGQLVKALPKMVKAANAEALRLALTNHLEETKLQVDRLKQSFALLGVAAEPKPCRGMAGLIEEGEEVMEEGQNRADAVAADLALIAAAQKVEHYEISAYGTARTMAAQVGLPNVAELLAKSLAEEETSDNLLTQIARELFSEARTGTQKKTTRSAPVSPAAKNRKPR